MRLPNLARISGAPLADEEAQVKHDTPSLLGTRTAFRWFSLALILSASLDQAQGAGWRTLADRQKFDKGAVLIQDYLPLHPELSSKEKAVHHFHAAQLLAVAVSALLGHLTG